MKNKTITDLEGREIEVTDIEAAITQARAFKDLRHETPIKARDRSLRRYWNDLYQKLLKLRAHKH